MATTHTEVAQPEVATDAGDECIAEIIQVLDQVSANDPLISTSEHSWLKRLIAHDSFGQTNYLFKELMNHMANSRGEAVLVLQAGNRTAQEIVLEAAKKTASDVFSELTRTRSQVDRIHAKTLTMKVQELAPKVLGKVIIGGKKGKKNRR